MHIQCIPYCSCEFVHATCLHTDKHDTPIELAHMGPCYTASTQAQVTTTTGGPATTPTAAQTTTPASQPPAATTAPLNALIQQVFCANIGSISCSGFAIVCGTDGKLYPNQ